MSQQPFNSDGGFSTTGNITAGNISTLGPAGDITGANNISAIGNVTSGNITTGGTANLNSVRMSQGISWPDSNGSEIYEDGGLVINGPGGVYAQGNIAARFEFNDGAGNSSGLYSDIGNSLVYSVGNVIVRSNNLSQTDWTFGTDGNLSIPGNLNYDGVASPAPSINGFSSVNAQNFSATGNVIADGNITTTGSGGDLAMSGGDITGAGNLSLSGNFDMDGNATIGGNLFVTGNINFSGNVTQITGNSGVFYGNVQTGAGALYAGKQGFTALPNTVVQITGDDSSYVQVNLQNTNHGNVASMELAITADDGTDTTNYIDMGIASSTWDGTQDNSLGDAVDRRDGYLYVQGGSAGGNLVLGATTAGYGVKFNAGGPGLANTVAEIVADGFSTTGNVSAGGYLLGDGGLISNIQIQGGNTVITTTGNVSGGNLIATGTVSASGNITANYFFGNGSQLTGIAASYGNANVVANLAHLGSNPVSTTGNVNSGNVLTGGLISATGNVTGGNLITSGTFQSASLSSSGNLTFTANTANIVFNTGAYISGNANSLGRDGSLVLQPAANGTFQGVVVGGSGRLLAPNGSVHQIFNASDVTFQVPIKSTLNTPATSTSTGAVIIPGGAGFAGNVYAGNVYTPGLMSATGNVTGGNVSTAGIVSATGNVTSGNLLTAGQVSATGNATFNAVSLTGSSGNITGADQVLANAFSASGNVTSSGLTVFGSATITGNTTVQGTLTYNNLTNITTPNLVFGLANTSTGISANGAGFVVGNTSQASFLYNYGTTAWISNIAISAVGNLTGGNVLTGGLISSTGNITGGNISATNHTGTTVSVSGNVTGGNVVTGGVVSATGNVTGNYILGNGALLTGVITSVANINSGTSNVTVVSSGGNISVGVGGTGNVAVFATTGEYVTGVVSASGNVTGGNVLTGGLISATGNLTAGNVSATNIVGTLTTAAQPNITSVGTLSALTVTANVTGGNVLTSGLISSTGNITGGNISATNHTGTTVSVSGNVTGGNVLTGGLISSTGNITGGNISATNHTGTTVSVSGNITAGNIINTGISSVTGNITAGNIATAGQVSATGNVTTPNYFIGNVIGTTVSTTGNISAGNVIANNVIINGQQTNYGVVTPAFMVVGLASSVSGFGSGSTVIFDTVVGNTNSQTSYNASTGVFTLTAGVAYDMSFTPSFITFTNPTTGYLCYQWVDATTNTPLDSTGTGIGTGISSQDTTAQQDNTTARVIYTPNTNQTVKLLVTSGNGTVTLRGGIGTQAVIKPLNPTIAVTANPVGFRATTPVTNLTVNNGASATMLFGTEEVDTNSAYNPATGRFTPNVAGYYSVDWYVVTSANGAGELLASLNKNGGLVAWGTNQTTATAHWNGMGGSASMIYLNGTTDYISITLTNNSGSTATILAASGLSYFSAYLIR